MLDSDRIDDLARLYRVFGKVPLGIKELKKGMKDTVKERGEKINEGFQDGAAAGPSTSAGVDEAEKDPKGKGKGKEVAGTGGAAGALQSALRWVQEVLDLKDKFDTILREAFSGDKNVQTAINEVSRVPLAYLNLN